MMGIWIGVAMRHCIRPRARDHLRQPSPGAIARVPQLRTFVTVAVVVAVAVTVDGPKTRHDRAYPTAPRLPRVCAVR